MTSGNFDMTDDRVTSPDRRDLLHHLSLAAMIPGIAVIVRQTTTNIDAGAGLPWKNVMGFWILGYTDFIMAINSTGTGSASYDARANASTELQSKKKRPLITAETKAKQVTGANGK
ncbi:uncharacterized protein ACA1_033680 [Acanthamoeba castellanii str. Neff]|uniref:Uncharacterized protein n=1 Tax=Acanthamoeba castellanii (strain ATCC 30010 / Neff) TaxID=1257118 RepID=L8GGL5_ACACF|nr:uncharacterized protein ACA1_033680 [Acanthamoeba castellanii str. Neff]ELR12220.1 hypothetical protein ACA1_033680 [Acanthamoeba castellanii str. Neff]